MRLRIYLPIFLFTLAMFAELATDTLIVHAKGLALPASQAEVLTIDFKTFKIRPPDWAVAALALLAHRQHLVTIEMLEAALALRFKDQVLDKMLELL